MNQRPIWLLVGQALSALLTFVSAPLIARLIGPEGRGITVTVSALVYIIPIIIAFGGPQNVRREIASNPDADLSRYIRTYAFIAAVACVPTSFICWYTVLSPLTLDDKVAAVAWIALSFVAVAWMSQVSALLAKNTFRPVMYMQVAPPAILLFGALTYSAFAGLTVKSVIGLGILGTLASWIIGHIGIRAQRQTRSSEATQKTSYLSIIRTGVKYYGAAIAEALSYRILLVLALPAVGAANTGYLSVGMTVSALLLIVPQTIASSYFAMIAVENGSAAANAAIRQVLSIMILLAPIAGAAAVPMVPILFGHEFIDAIAPTVLIAIGSICIATGYSVVLLLIARGRGGAATVAYVIGLIVQIVGLHVLASFGALGCSVAYCAGFLFVAITGACLLRLDWRAVPRLSGLKEAIATMLTGRQPRTLDEAVA